LRWHQGSCDTVIGGPSPEFDFSSVIVILILIELSLRLRSLSEFGVFVGLGRRS
jgi:hypothetical protein